MSHIAEPRPCSSSLTRSPSVSFPRWRLSFSLSLTRSFTFSPRCDASGPSETGSQHKERHSLCLNDTLHYGRHITCLRGVAGSGVTRMDAILAQTSSQPAPPPLSSTHVLQSRHRVCLFVPFPKKLQWHHPKASPLVTRWRRLRLPVSVPGTPDSAATPRLGGGWSSY